MSKLHTYKSSETPTVLRLEGEIRRLNNKIVFMKRQYNIPWDDSDLIEGRCTLNDIRQQRGLREVYVDA